VNDKEPTDLISMAEIASLAGESRSTVGNWKARDPDGFPRERGRSSRGPLYDRNEVVSWLRERNRLSPVDVDGRKATTLWETSVTMPADSQEFRMVLSLIRVRAAGVDELKALGGPVENAPRSADAGDQSETWLVSRLPFSSLPHYRDWLRHLLRLSDAEVQPTAERLLNAYLTRSSRDHQALTTPLVRRLMVELCEPCGVLYLPAVGTGQLLIDAMRTPAGDVDEVLAQEINDDARGIAEAMAGISGVKAEIAGGDVFAEDAFQRRRADRILCVPPMHQRLPQLENLSDDPRWVYGEPGEADGSAAWIQHCLAHLAENGRAVLLLPDSALYESGRGGRIRQRIVKAGLIRAVIALPRRALMNSNIEASVVVFGRDRSANDLAGSTLMVDLRWSDLQPDPDLNEKSIQAAVATCRAWFAGSRTPAPGTRVAAFEEIVSNDFVMTPANYTSAVTDNVDIEEVRRQRTEAVRALLDRARIASEASNRLASLLGGDR
jgi:hypothetical protein